MKKEKLVSVAKIKRDHTSLNAPAVDLEFSPWLGLFESVRVITGNPLLPAEHLLSIREGSAELGLSKPPDFPSFASALPQLSGRWRWIHSSHESRTFFQPESKEQATSYSLELAPQRLGSCNWDARYKTLSYLTHWQARKSVQADEALLLNEHGEIASGAMSNLFWINRGQLFTPDLAAGCRNGVIRRWVFQLFQPISVRSDIQSIIQAEEIFLTNSMIGIKPISRFNGKSLPIGPLTSEILSRYKKQFAVP